MPEAISVESRRHGVTRRLRIIARFGFGRRNVSDRLQQSLVVEPVDPFERGELDRLEVAPRPAPPDHFGFVESVDGLGEGVVVAVADAADGRLDAGVLTGEGHRSPNCTEKVLPVTVHRIRLGVGIKVTAQRNRWSHDPSSLSATELAARLNIPVNWLYVQIRQKRLLIDRQPTGAYLFRNSPSVMDAIRNLRNHTISHIDLRICQPHQEGHQHA